MFQSYTNIKRAPTQVILHQGILQQGIVRLLKAWLYREDITGASFEQYVEECTAAHEYRRPWQPFTPFSSIPPVVDTSIICPVAIYPFFQLPALRLLDHAMGVTSGHMDILYTWLGTSPYGLIRPNIVLYAVLVYIYISRDLLRKIERRTTPQGRQGNPPTPSLDVFVVYFPYYLKYHEAFRLSGYLHPFR